MNECLLCEQSIASTPSWQVTYSDSTNKRIFAMIVQKSSSVPIIRKKCDILDQITSLYTYNEAMRDYLHQLNFLQDVQLADVFAHELRSHLPAKAIIVPIPMHPEKKIQRTFAHVDELLKSAGIPYTHLLEKIDTDAMGEKSKAQRLAMKPLFAIKEGTTIQQETYILVDDIYTTGTTLRHAATVLKEAGATRVEALTLIRA